MNRINTITLSGTIERYPVTSWLPGGELCTALLRADIGGFITELQFFGDSAKPASRMHQGQHVTVCGQLKQLPRTISHYGKRIKIYDNVIDVINWEADDEKDRKI